MSCRAIIDLHNCSVLQVLLSGGAGAVPLGDAAGQHALNGSSLGGGHNGGQTLLFVSVEMLGFFS